MFDSVNFRLTRSDYNGADFLSEVPCYITDISEHHYENGIVITGCFDSIGESVPL